MADEADLNAPPAENPPAEGDAAGEGVATAADASGPLPLKAVFLGNLTPGYRAEDVTKLFQQPLLPPTAAEGSYTTIPVDRIDLKRGYCFVFLKDAVDAAAKDQAERFVSDINGMNVPGVSQALRAEFARGDGRVKRKEDERRKDIRPSETLFVVNFHEETTKKEDLEMLFQPFGELVRIDMKGNYAFVQFNTVEEAIAAKEATNGGKLDRSVLTVEYVARQRGDRDRRGRGDRRGGGRDRYDDRRGPPPSRSGGPPDYGRRDRYDDRRGGYDDFRGGSDRYRDRSPPGGGYRGRRSRSGSFSPPSRYRSRSPPRSGGGRYDDRGGGGRYDDRGGSSSRYDDYRDGGGRRSPGYRDYDRDRDRSPDRDFYRGGDRDRDRGYRP